MDQKNSIEAYRADLLKEIERIRDGVRKKRADRGYVSEPAFLDGVHAFLRSELGKSSPDFPFGSFEVDFIEKRGNFDADIVFKSTALLSADKAAYMGEQCPKLAELLKGVKKDGEPFFEDVRTVGIYVNAKLRPKHLFFALGRVLSLDGKFGESTAGKGRDIVIDYSSPNAAKHLHAGHIRSTIIGHVFGNIYEACGYTVHRVNYLNDWGGMGFLMEGLSRRTDTDIESYENKNDLLFEIYSAFRKAEKTAPSDTEFVEFSRKANEKFAALERGEEGEYRIWKKIVDWSMADFERFYDILGIHQDYLTGESLYAKSGKDLVLEKVASGKGSVVFFDSKEADKAIALLAKSFESGEIAEEVYERKKEEVFADIGSYVVPLDNGERYVVLKKDGSTIYATRDLAALDHRIRVFSPVKVVYEVGQEQQEHFDKLFRSAKAMGIASGVELVHVYHGFYVDEATKKKLSSRDGASNIMKLLTDTIAYFRSKYDGSDEFSESEKDHLAKVLGVGSVVFNDIKKDRKSSVAISADFEKMMKSFEESGGAYLIYASCRAKSILRKYAKGVPNISDIKVENLQDIEVDLIKKILSFPEVVKRAGAADDPVRIAEFITNLAALYNSYYNSVPILKGNAVEQGIAISKCVSTVIDNGLDILHVGTLERI